MKEQQYVLCWSQSQNTLQAETMVDHVRQNRIAYGENKRGDFRILLVGTRGEVEATAASIKPTLTKRQQAEEQAA